MNQEELTLTICALCLELYFKVVLLMKVCVQAIWENVATKVKLLCVICKLSCKVCSQESCSLELECKAGGKFHVKLNICLRLIVYKYHEGNVKRTLKIKLHIPEIVAVTYPHPGCSMLTPFPFKDPSISPLTVEYKCP